MAYSKQTWTDEVLAALAKYLVKNDSGVTVYSEAEISLATEVSVAGTPVTAERMNHIEDGIAAVEAAIPLKATGAEAITGTVDTKFITPKALKDGGFVAIDLIGGIPHKQMYAAAGVIKPTLTNGCAAVAQIEMSTNKNVYDYLAFDKDAIEYGYFNVPMPQDYTGGVIYANFKWLHPATTTNFKASWGLQGVSFSNDDTLDAAQGTAIYANDEGGTTNDFYVSPTTAAITIAGTPTAGNLVQFRVSRKADDATNDTLAVDAFLLGVMIWYPVA